MTNIDSVLKSRDITLPTEVHLVKAMAFLVVMYGCESWTIRKAECWRIDALELWCWRRLLRVPWTSRRSNQSILKEISPGCSLEGLMLKLKLRYYGHLMQRFDSFDNTLMLGKIEGRRRRGQQRMRWLEWWTGRPGMLQSMGSQRIGHDWETELNWISYTSLHLKWTCILIQQNGKFIIHLTITVNVLGGIVQSHFLISPSLWLSVAWLITFTHPQFHRNSSDRSRK